MDRREFLAALALMSVPAGSPWATANRTEDFYRLPERRNAACLIHLTDCHAQLLPVHYREPDTNVGTGPGRFRVGHLTGDALLERYGFRRGTRQAHAYTHLRFAELARRYGRMGGFAHLSTLVQAIKVQRPGAVLVDGGDSWQGSATALWTAGEDMVAASRLLGVEVMTGHWEFTHGAARVTELADRMRGKIDFVAQNVFTQEFGDRAFASHVMRDINGTPVAIVGQAYPYTPIANPRHLVPDWTFGIREETLQATVDGARRDGAAAVVLLSHNGVDVDLKLASRVRGIDAILGGHTHDPLPMPVSVANAGGQTLVANAGSNGKFLGVLDIELQDKRVVCDYRLLPVFSDLLVPDPAMAQFVDRIRAPYRSRLEEPLGTAHDVLYRRGNFNGSFDELILRALIDTQQAQIALSPGFRWGTTLLPGETITFEALMAQTAITYPGISVRDLTGGEIKQMLEDIADNLFNPDPYYRQGGDMVRTAGLTYDCWPHALIGHRIGNLRHQGSPLGAGTRYRVAGWASVQEQESAAEPIWDIVRSYLLEHGGDGPVRPWRPQVR